jgi:hypothetical protein
MLKTILWGLGLVVLGVVAVLFLLTVQSPQTSTPPSAASCGIGETRNTAGACVATTAAPAPTAATNIPVVTCPAGTTPQTNNTCLAPTVCAPGTSKNLAGECEKPAVTTEAPPPIKKSSEGIDTQTSPKLGLILNFGVLGSLGLFALAIVLFVLVRRTTGVVQALLWFPIIFIVGLFLFVFFTQVLSQAISWTDVQKWFVGTSGATPTLALISPNAVLGILACAFLITALALVLITSVPTALRIISGFVAVILVGYLAVVFLTPLFSQPDFQIWLASLPPITWPNPPQIAMLLGFVLLVLFFTGIWLWTKVSGPAGAVLVATAVLLGFILGPNYIFLHINDPWGPGPGSTTASTTANTWCDGTEHPLPINAYQPLRAGCKNAWGIASNSPANCIEVVLFDGTLCIVCRGGEAALLGKIVSGWRPYNGQPAILRVAFVPE